MQVAPTPTVTVAAEPAATQDAQQAAVAGDGSLTLDQAVSQALQTNPAVRSAVQQLAQAQAAVAQAEAQRHFQLTFNSSAGISDADVIQPPPSHETFHTLQNTLTIPLPIGRKPSLAVRQAQNQLIAAQAQFRASRLALAGQVVAAYYDLLRKQALLAAAQQSLALAQGQLTNAQSRYLAGDVAQIDVLQAQVPVASAQAAVTQATTAVAVSQEVLNDLLGRPLDAQLAIVDITGPVPALPFSLQQARQAALRYSSDIIAADATVRANQAALESARLYREPTVSLQAIDQRSNDQTSFSRLDTIQAQVSVPLSDGGLGRAQTQSAQAALAQSRYQAQSVRKTVLVNVSSAYLNAQSSRAQVESTRAARDIAQTTYDKTIQGYRNGLFPFVNVITAQNALALARIAYIQALYDAASAQSTLNAAVQGLATNPVAAPAGTAPAATNGTSQPSSNTTTGAPGTSGATTPGSTTPPGASTNGTSPAGAGMPGTTPVGTSTTGSGTTGKGTP